MGLCLLVWAYLLFGLGSQCLAPESTPYLLVEGGRFKRKDATRVADFRELEPGEVAQETTHWDLALAFVAAAGGRVYETLVCGGSWIAELGSCSCRIWHLSQWCPGVLWPSGGGGAATLRAG